MQNLGAWKPLFLCKGRGNVVEPTSKRRPRKILQARDSQSACGLDGREDRQSSQILQEGGETVATPSQQPTKSSSYLNVQREFFRATANIAADAIFTTVHEIPDLEEAYGKFKTIYPKFFITEKVDELRAEEYGHLEQHHRKVCLDYCGFGLFSHSQAESYSFGLSQISVNLRSHALDGMPNNMEKDLRNRIMEFLNIHAGEYSMVFTVNRGSAFKLLGESYPFHQNRRLLTMYDYDSQSVNWMAEIARNKGAKIRSGCFTWPSLKPCSTELKKELKHKKSRRKDSAVGVFVFPFQSRVTGAKYSSQWMALAQQNGWHVLLDAGALGPKDMDSLGLSLFRPDFIITSFYKVFGEDPTGFGCLFIKNSVVECLEDQAEAPSVGIVSIVPSYSVLSDCLLSDSADEEGSKKSEAAEEDEIETGLQLEVPAFSGPFSSLQVRDVVESDVGSSFRDGVSEDIDNASALKSPIFSEEENDNLFCIDLGQSPVVSGPLRKGNSGHLLYKSTHKHLLTRSPKSPLYDEGNTDSSVVSSDAPFSSELDLPKEGDDVPTLVAERGHPPHEAGSDPTTNGKCHKFEFLDPGDSPLSEQEKVHGNGVTALHGSDGAHNLISEDDVGSSGRIGSSRRLFKQSKLTFILENAEGEGQDASPKQGQIGVEEVSESTSNEITICSEDTKDLTTSNGSLRKLENGSVLFKNHELKLGNKENHVMNGSPQLCGTKENAISRENEGEFRLLGRRETGRLLDLEAIDSISRRVSFSVEEEEESGAADHQIDEGMSDAEIAEEQSEPKIMYKHLDHVDGMGLNRITLRHRYLINWLVTSLLQLRHPGPDGGVALVHIYGPKVKYDRGASVAFNLYDSKGSLVPPELVQRLADKSNIALGLGFLSHLKLMENHLELQDAIDSDDIFLCQSIVNGRCEGKRALFRVEVVTASLGFLSNFEDVYRMWSFVAKFLDAEFVEAHQTGTSER